MFCGCVAPALLLGLTIGTHRECVRIVAERVQDVLELERALGGRKTRQKCRY